MGSLNVLSNMLSLLNVDLYYTMHNYVYLQNSITPMAFYFLSEFGSYPELHVIDAQNIIAYIYSRV